MRITFSISSLHFSILQRVEVRTCCPLKAWKNSTLFTNKNQLKLRENHRRKNNHGSAEIYFDILEKRKQATANRFI